MTMFDVQYSYLDLAVIVQFCLLPQTWWPMNSSILSLHTSAAANILDIGIVSVLGIQASALNIILFLLIF